ncbi:hypothetical protein BDY19DRAFT_966249 [Irpex rosettiformis]|uniref:Uncharacterized protein n=1 Tax=Irpex rosettiformis TaxID=378272 RepID=A0ACB8TU29_9APHY|nr:hypothetical protein BDY19DRAFT_966249 [Irpex rosettiformis]
MSRLDPAGMSDAAGLNNSRTPQRIHEFFLYYIQRLAAEAKHVVYLAWCFIPLLYEARLRHIIPSEDCDSERDSSRSQEWRTALGEVIKLSRAASGIGFSCMCIGAYIVQNSYWSWSAMLGLILMILGIENMLTAFMVFLYIKLVAQHTDLFDLAVLRKDFVTQTAAVLAVPATSSIRCLLLAAISIMFYAQQSNVPQIDVQSYLPEQGATRNSHSHVDSRPPPLPSADHVLTLGQQICVGVVVGLLFLRALFVLYFILRLSRSTQRL